MTSANDFLKWLSESRTGGMCIYYTGFLAVDRFTIVGKDPETQITIRKPEIDDLARVVIDAFDRGRVHLFQRKLHDNEYQYIAMKSSRRLW